jgi:hydroxyacylglutathione hydrolase
MPQARDRKTDDRDPDLVGRPQLRRAPTAEVAVVVDPQRDIDRVLEVAMPSRRRADHPRLETHIHNDYVTGGYALAEPGRCAYHVNADDPVAYERHPGP